MQDELLSIGQTVRLFAGQGVTEAKLRNWIKTGRLPAYRSRFDGTIVVKPADVQMVLESRGQYEPVNIRNEEAQ